MVAKAKDGLVCLKLSRVLRDGHAWVVIERIEVVVEPLSGARELPPVC